MEAQYSTVFCTRSAQKIALEYFVETVHSERVDFTAMRLVFIVNLSKKKRGCFWRARSTSTVTAMHYG